MTLFSDFFLHSVCSFKTTRSLLAHRRLIHTDRRYHCLHCDKNFRFKQSLKRHLHHHTTGTIAKPFGCEMCGKAYPVESALKVLFLLKIYHEIQSNNGSLMHISVFPLYASHRRIYASIPAKSRSLASIVHRILLQVRSELIIKPNLPKGGELIAS